MDDIQAYGILKEIVLEMLGRGERVKALPDSIDREKSLEESGMDLIAFSEIAEEFQQRFNGRDFHLDAFMVPEEYYYLTLGKFLDLVCKAFRPSSQNPIVVYVDDEEENLFVFKRRFGKELNLKSFTNPFEALAFVKSSPDVALVITDEVMPGLGGNALCDEVKKTKPNMKFILITGNPNSDGDLMYRTLRSNRFYDFISKPVDFANKGGQYFKLIQDLISSK
jgi:CheY-like chemotaxis protein